jgi:uncharacterized protein YbjT (DUF2867 family)
MHRRRKEDLMREFVTGATGHIGSTIVPPAAAS